MLNIDENKLKLLLEQRKSLLERKRYDGIGDIISSVEMLMVDESVNKRFGCYRYTNPKKNTFMFAINKMEQISGNV